MSYFSKQLAFGKLGENVIANWFKASGYGVLPVYEKEINEGKGPQFFVDGSSFIAPDLLVFNENEILWVEAKRKSAFTWHRLTERWTTGIDLKHYLDYLKVMEHSPWPIWLMFLQEGGKAKDTPPGMVSPTGLYGGDLRKLKDNENHRHGSWGRSGMVYWAKRSLTKIMELDEILKYQSPLGGGRTQKKPPLT